MSDLKEYHDKTFANRLTMFRKQYVHKVQNKAATLLDIAQSNLSYMENGKSPIRFDFIAKLVKEYGLNQEWFTSGRGNLTSENIAKDNSLTDINLVNEELELLKKYIKIIELNQNYMLKRMEQMEKELAKKR